VVIRKISDKRALALIVMIYGAIYWYVISAWMGC